MTLATHSVPARPAFPRLLRGIFDTPANAIVTLLLATFLYLVVWPAVRWALIDATWAGNAEACRARSGACWAFIFEKARFIVFGLYPHELAWQAGGAVVIISALVVATALPALWSRRLIVVWFIAIGAAIALMSGAVTNNPVPTSQWGGFPLTLLLAVVGFAAAFPMGVLLALARQSRLRILSTLAVAFIEALRGVPLIAVLYFSTLLLPLMLPEGVQIDKLLRAQVAIVLFVSAYMAEIVRAGLQAVPASQSEAAASLGLNGWMVMRLVVLPQAFRAVIPSFVNLAIGLFLDTTLVIVIGLLDFLNTAKTAASDPAWIGFYDEGFFFAAMVYFTICFGGSRYSLWLERRLRRGRR